MLDSSIAAPLPVLALVAGLPFTETPADLFIPPDALEVLLDSFAGPLDLLLYLIRRQNIDILDIPIAHITHQYMQYIELMETHRLELAADYLVMAAMLAEIKSRMLLPLSPSQEEGIEADPRMELIRKLQAYEQIKNAASLLDDLPRCDRDFFRFSIACETIESAIIHPEVQLANLTEAMRDLMKRQSHSVHHQITREILSVRERMTAVLESLDRQKTIAFSQLFSSAEGRMGLVVTFLAVLELARQSLLTIIQPNAYATIYLQAVGHE
ncbi:MAG: segregation/condensation protein A [Tatlockia sp.]|nr:segregation/condensation protein A [Tatlockia sp.]